MVALLVGVPGNWCPTGVEAMAHPETRHLLLCFPVYLQKLRSPTYAANGQREAYSVQHRGGDGAVVEGVLDAVIVTEKAPLIGTHFTQVKGC